jgi:hypothetical protein
VKDLLGQVIEEMLPVILIGVRWNITTVIIENRKTGFAVWTLTGLTTKIAAAMSTTQSLRASSTANYDCMLKGMALERARVTARQYTIAVLVTPTSKSQPVIGLLDCECLAMFGAGDWETTIQVKTAFGPHKVNNRRPESIASNGVIVTLRRCQSNGVAKEV